MILPFLRCQCPFPTLPLQMDRSLTRMPLHCTLQPENKHVGIIMVEKDNIKVT